MGADQPLVDLLASASPIGLFAIFIVALLRRWLVLPRELDECQKRIGELERERDEYKRMVLKTLDLGERLTSERERDRA